ncbi:sulfurtransferase TusA family protein [Natroniella sulfidigena]|uniref:sulfurtransferase TusA family protein n=1 Tax=Natroniella sulfidigena TaxID=723921 RepID=UPI00200AA728|nr:sulfurtransferase TusA family protein [Natroniella sulfidigena]MCK8816114.1 sulfurtransferase TusA family protein [Natroniella sulfidigena]
MKTEPVFKIPETVKEDTNKYQQEVERFLAGEIDSVRFKGYRVPMGVYGQRGAEGEEQYMVRVRAPGGVITVEQLQRLNQLSKEYGSEYLHLTTRQDVQIHQVEIEDTPQVLFDLLEVGLSPRGGGGNTVRNIANASRAGVDSDEVFDTTPHALALTEYLIKTRSSFNLPRKYKIAFSSTPADEGLATINDLGFIAQEKNGKKGFKVYAAGGMGTASEVAFLIEEFIPEDKIFHVAEAIKRFFDEYGDRSNKHKARLRFVKKRLGEEEFKAKYKEYLADVLAENIETHEINEYQLPREEVSTELEATADYLEEEKVAGYYSVELRPENGDLNAQELDQLLEIELLSAQEVDLRTTNRQSLLIRGVRAEQVEQLVEEIRAINSDLLSANHSTVPIACKGASTCRLGLCLSPNLAEEIRAKLTSLADDLQELLPQIYISGCPNACGQHLIGKIGLEGKAKRFNGKLVPHYSLLLGGNIADGNSKYGERVIDLPAKRIPDFLADLAEELATEEDYNPAQFNQYLEAGGEEKVKELAAEFVDIPAYEEDSDLYRDWGQDADFSLAGRGPGECGVGVMDIIKLDLDTAQENYKQAVAEEDADQLYQAIVNAARALLIVKGVDTQKDRVIIKEFKDKFIDGQLVATDYEEVVDAAIDYKLGDITDLFAYQEGVKELIARIEKLFNSLNAKLEFTIVTEEATENDNSASNEATDKEVADLRGVKCPMNFVKAKVAIAPLSPGEIIDIYLDEGEPIANVPQSLSSEGHEILAKEQAEDGYYILTVKKAS